MSLGSTFVEDPVDLFFFFKNNYTWNIQANQKQEQLVCRVQYLQICHEPSETYHGVSELVSKWVNKPIKYTKLCLGLLTN